MIDKKVEDFIDELIAFLSKIYQTEFDNIDIDYNDDYKKYWVKFNIPENDCDWCIQINKDETDVLKVLSINQFKKDVIDWHEDDYYDDYYYPEDEDNDPF